MRKIVSNTGPLITLEKMEDGYQFIQKLYDKIIIPPKGLEELTVHHNDSYGYLEMFKISHLLEINREFNQIQIEGIEELDDGEIEAISLAKRMNLDLLIEDDDGRKIAMKAKIPFSGIAGRILRAYENKVIDKTEASDPVSCLNYSRKDV